MDCDEAVAGTAPLFRQLLNASAEESATEVARGLIQARGCVDYFALEMTVSVHLSCETLCPGLFYLLVPSRMRSTSLARLSGGA